VLYARGDASSFESAANRLLRTKVECPRGAVVCLVASTLGRDSENVLADDPDDDDARDLAASTSAMFRVCRASDRAAVDALLSDVLRKALQKREAALRKGAKRSDGDDDDAAAAATQKELLCYAIALFVLLVLQSN